jgi:hypothetical protein
MRRFLAGKVSVVEDGRMDGYFMRSNGINGTTSPSSLDSSTGWLGVVRPWS